MKDETKKGPHIVKMGEGHLTLGAALVPIVQNGEKVQCPAMVVNRMGEKTKLVGLNGTPLDGKPPEVDLLIIVPTIEAAEILLKTTLAIYEIFENSEKEKAKQ